MNALRHRYGMALAVLIASMATPAASAEPCGRDLPPAEIRVSTEHTFPRVSYAHSSGEIRRQLGSAPRMIALGLTQSSTALSVEVQLQSVRDAGGELLCARPEVRVTLRHAHLDVWIASELQRDACVSAIVLEHEMQHVAIERDTLDWAAQQLESRLQAWYQDRVLQGSESDIKAGLVRDFAQRWTPVLEELLDSSRPRHAAFDQRDSYGDASACGGDLFRSARYLQ